MDPIESEVDLLENLVEQAQAWRDFARARGHHPVARRYYRELAVSLKVDARDLIRSYVPDARLSLRSGLITVPFPVGSPDREILVSPSDFGKLYIDVHNSGA